MVGAPVRPGEPPRTYTFRAELRRLGASARHPVQYCGQYQPDARLDRRTLQYADADHLHRARVRLAGMNPEPRLGLVEGRGGDRADGRPGHLARRRVDAGGHVGGDDRRTRAVHRLDHGRLARRSRRAGTEHRIDDPAGAVSRAGARPTRAAHRAAAAAARRRHRAAPRAGRRPARRPPGPPAAAAAPPPQPVTAVVACRRPRRSARRAVPRRHGREPLPRALHQVERRHAAHLDRPAVGGAHLLGVRQRTEPAHVSTATAAAMPLVWVSETLTFAPSSAARRSAAPSAGPTAARRRRPAPPRRASSIPAAAAPSRPPPWRRTAQPDASPAARAWPHTPAHRR